MVASERAAALAATEFFDFDTLEVREYAERCAAGADDVRQRAIQLYYAVRDGLRYDMYGADLSRSGMRASAILRKRAGFCVHKCIVFVAAARALEIPARIAFCDVRNHLCTERLRKLIGGDVFHYHAYAELHLGESWVKVTPVFNRALCAIFRMAPLEFDGLHDSTLHPFDEEGRVHMEFLAHHGSFDELPYDDCLRVLSQFHPGILGPELLTIAGSLELERSHDSTSR